jgi:hypothetical protein
MLPVHKLSPKRSRADGAHHAPDRPCVYKDSVDYSVFSGEWLIGRIYERKASRMMSGFSGRCTAWC